VASKVRYLVETSALEPALGNSTPRHVAHFQQETSCERVSSVYIRKEFIRRWFCDMVRLALTVAQHGNVADALAILSQDFGRAPKSALSAIGRFLRDRGAFDNSAQAAEEIASLAYRTLLLFDHVFGVRIGNACGCQIGGRSPDADCNHLLDNLQEFYVEFVEPVKDCPVNGFLDLANEQGRARQLTRHPRAGGIDSVEKLSSYAAVGRQVSCPECGPIGDAVIALEQPTACCLVHIDAAFNVLCPALQREHKQLKSLLAVEKSAAEAGT
jgi:hypothetical protein